MKVDFNYLSIFGNVQNILDFPKLSIFTRLVGRVFSLRNGYFSFVIRLVAISDWKFSVSVSVLAEISVPV